MARHNKLTQQITLHVNKVRVGFFRGFIFIFIQNKLPHQNFLYESENKPFLSVKEAIGRHQDLADLENLK